MFVKPKPGMRVRRPDSMRPLPEDGAEVPDGDLFWTRRIAQGDVEVVDAPPAEAPPWEAQPEAKPAEDKSEAKPALPASQE